MTLKEWKNRLAKRDPKPGRSEWLLDEIIDELSAAEIADQPFEIEPRLRLVELKARAIAEGRTRLEQLLDELIDQIGASAQSQN